jgi:hypothetical protein
MSVDEFLNSGGDRSRGGGRLIGWKKDGSVKVALAKKLWCAKSWNHPVPKVIEVEDFETKEKSLVVRTDRWTCHEVEELLMHRYDRVGPAKGHGPRSMPPTVCPCCLLPEVVRSLVESGKLSWTEPLFRWCGDDEDEATEIRAGGIYNLFNTKEIDRDRQKIAELRKAKIVRADSWNQSMLVRLQWCFLVVNLAKPEDGVLRDFESKGLGEKMKKAIKDEMRRHKTDPSRGDPTKHPYPFEWAYDETKSFDDKYDVLALTEETLSPVVLAAIVGPAGDI